MLRYSIKLKTITQLAFLLLFSCLFLITANSQSTLQTRTLFYKPASNINGLTPVSVAFNYKVINAFGTIEIIYSAKCTSDLAYQYKGRTYTFTGMDASVRKVVAKDPVINVLVTGPNGFKKEMNIGVISGVGGGSLSANSSTIKFEAKTKEEKDPHNYTVTPIQVVSVSYDNSWDIQAELEKKIRDEQKNKEIEELIKKGDRAMLMQDYVEAQSEYLKAQKLDKSNQYLPIQLIKAKNEIEKKSANKKFEELMNAAKSAEAKGDLAEAERLYRDAASAGTNYNGAQNDLMRVKSLREKAKKEKEDQIKKLQDKIEEDQKISKDLDQKKNLETKKVLEERQNEEEKLVKEKMDKLNEDLAKEEKQKLEEKQKKYWKDKADEEDRKEKAEKDEEKKMKELIKKNDDKRFENIEKNMSYDREEYFKNLKIAQALLQKASEIKPWDEMQLKKEWWDNNQYIQMFAEDLYEPQRKENHQRYMKKVREEIVTYHSAKEAFIYAMNFVDKGSEKHLFLLKKIEYCNEEVAFMEKVWSVSFKYEWNRPELREQAKIIREAQVTSNNFNKAQLAYAALDRTAENQAENLTKKYALAQRMNNAEVKYKQDMAVAGVSQSIVMSAITNENKSAAYVKNASLLNVSAFSGYSMLPILINQTSDINSPVTEINSLGTILANGGMDIWIYRSNFFDLNLGGNIGLGIGYPSKGYSEYLLHYGGKVNFDFGFKRFKLATTCEFLNRIGEVQIDYDVFNANNAIISTASNRQGVGNFNYSIFRVGAGFKIDLSDEVDMSHIWFNVFAEKPSFYPKDIFSEPIYSYQLEYLTLGGLAFNVAYANNYAIAGEKKYPISEVKNKAYFQFTFGKYWTIL
jgi:hypothetical protein